MSDSILAYRELTGGTPAPFKASRRRRSKALTPERREQLRLQASKARDARHDLYTEGDIGILRREYPAGDLDALARMLGRTKNALGGKAFSLGILRTVSRSERRTVWKPTPEIDAQIRAEYQKPQLKKGQIEAFAARIGWPRWAVSRRAIALGVVSPRKKEPDWCDKELQLLEQWGHKTPLVIKKKLRASGFHRSETGILLKRKRMSLTAAYLEHGYTASKLAEAFGVDIKSVTGWIEKGWLSAGRRGTVRKPQQGGDMWWIKATDVRAFILDSVEVIDLAKVNKSWFVDIVAGRYL